MVVNDEMEAWPGDQGLKQYEVMTSALGARKQPLILSISTAGYINDGIYDELDAACNLIPKRQFQGNKNFAVPVYD